MTAAESSHLRNAIRETACRMWNRGVVNPGLFLRAFEERYGAAIGLEDLRFGFQQWVVGEGVKALKRVGKDARDVTGGRQMVLPMNLAELDIQSSVQIKRGWVPLWATEDADLDEYTAVLQDNCNACIAKLTNWLQFVKEIRPILRANPGWNTGDALRYLCDRERGAA
jgi:hypothetical protein